ncbi:DUF6249 domain-containing protein [Alicyclobacillus mengziensis]|uniref:DUF6249 domain-containing protein n=1 Tax=Alicyclobacillus mengziensis TaxID=2931921 RepID=A0A9X7Z4Y8_9BACL|nr:DUF6249 domain-containing protein [Alicyclobacillus mengziensis]QSO45842.1 hypothetical protein JZ786_14990 [Alicyclobacillus mengziensis]
MNVTPFSFEPFAWIPIVGILFPVFVLAVIFGFVALIRYLRYRERMMMIQKGIVPADFDRAWRADVRMQARSRRQPRGGIITSLVGLALLVGLWTLGTGPWLLGGLIPLAVGIGELLTWVITSPTQEALRETQARSKGREPGDIDDRFQPRNPDDEG